MKIAVTGMLIAASLTGIAAPATAYADDVPSVDQVMAIMAELTDPDRPAANKTDIVSPGFSPDEAGTIDDHLHQMLRDLPPEFVVNDIQPASDNFAGATVSTLGGIRRASPPGPIVLVNQGGHWMLTHQSAISALDAYWRNSRKHIIVTAPR
jgi:hypothetical protein